MKERTIIESRNISPDFADGQSGPGMLLSERSDSSFDSFANFLCVSATQYNRPYCRPIE